ncbi:MAG: GNAT family acetyltransferase [Gammaproteobacteria bacterium]|nr:GNAT family acetyltransferase [Gammaproteobacteria bacterium]
MKLILQLPRFFYSVIGVILVGIAFLLILFAVTEVIKAMQFDGGRTIDELLNAIGIVVISTALIDVAKFLVEEEVLNKRRSTPSAKEIRRSLSKFLSIIVIAICMEALVFVFKAGKSGSEALIYPTLLFMAGITAVVGLGLFLKFTPEENNSRTINSKPDYPSVIEPLSVESYSTPKNK